ncbi:MULTISPECIES: non-hydrolyzing UDP-N-acetylglucosamine 2-epimerase [Caldilinea]|jgi:UDP-GlcNAc3NAcA epimerase|uniref:Putative UDP-N-acetylglucosamine 2-epimerase n=1 Tax=Caldilinea aerophila (strain DSM 14535 / JCM 11387 / NBRC 104270 / STL-6-O1) TaxID=926550 RepID=I0I8S0_CALAS|nr:MULTISPECIES: UDP-N-acetylglucosamine 2-epimerase (non-hydrolyzing) [Caldilinea]MBO9392556.1 UDP-N-acetylglucosamine 2-epimerase (non-hydrolyzing) [Caldilinea sp.]BAM01658.1 putative UDP-N-acetylglucosamine 2-epimerase [Caldilinea aerophila DSM 14535 = NBRC 104270]GIV72996.1 MAG: UDP-N-acetyl glucosamine 2-epimerase [Caldilinea sp.]
MKFVSVVGARPEFVQAAPVSWALRKTHTEILVHTGQHYDYAMSQAFFEELGVPAPDYNLEAGSGTHARQTAAMLVGMEEVLLKEKPDAVIVRGDTNSTVAGALAASKLGIPVVHIEAGERSFVRTMPEEINRIIADHLASLCFCVSSKSAANLAREGIVEGVHITGDVMLDASLHHRNLAREKSNVLERLQLESGRYALVTVHRAHNTDDPRRLRSIVEALNTVGERIVFPVHPRTRKALEAIGARFASQVLLTEPASYYDMMVLEENARLIATDSGGVQREAYYFAKPCLTLREETEWTETVEVGWNLLVGADCHKIVAAWHTFQPPGEHPPVLGDGTAAEKIAKILDEQG